MVLLPAKLPPAGKHLSAEITGIQNAGIFIYGHKDFQEEKWFDPDSKAVPKADELVLMALFFGCSTDYLIDLIE